MESSSLFEYRFRVSDDLLDGYGHVNNARYLDLFERARWDILAKSGKGESWVHENRIGPIIIEITIRYSQELLPGEEIKIISECRRKNELIFLFEQKMINPQGKTACRAVFTSSLFDLDKRKMVKADSEWLSALGF
ncbi:MAG: acyl-CoA thioesterase [Bacteroidales bacterium]|nr:acyl-CoA thioesterase [Bacteroidales bacterium]MCB9013912.1 acyl-CoA thioesterase [Bacteroidales bacterium]